MEVPLYIEDLSEIARICRDASELFEKEGFDDYVGKIDDAIRAVGRASSNSWLGYQANVYYREFYPPRPSDHFSSEWGFQSVFVQPVSDNWVEYRPEDVKKAIFKLADVSEKSDFIERSLEVGKLFEEKKKELETLLTVMLETSVMARLASKGPE